MIARLKDTWDAPVGGGLLNPGLANACSPLKALKWLELLLVYPWKCLVHLHGTEVGLGLGVCTLALTSAAVGAALGFARSSELADKCLQGSGCEGHDHCRPPQYQGVVGSFADCMQVG